MNSNPFYVITNVTIADLDIDFIDIQTMLSLSTLGVSLVSLSSSVGIGWYALSDLPNVTRGFLKIKMLHDTDYLETQTLSDVYQKLDELRALVLSALDPATTGLIPVKFNVIDSNTMMPIMNAQVSVWNNALSAIIIPKLITDQDGLVYTGLPNGDYKAFAFFDRAKFSLPQSFTVGAIPVTVEMLGDIKIVNPPMVGMVTVYGYVKDPNGVPLTAAIVRVRVIPDSQVINDTIIEKKDIEILTDEFGYFETQLMAQLRVSIQIPSTGYKTAGVLPLSGVMPITRLADDQGIE